MTYRERRTILIFWTVVALLIFSAFATEALLKETVCVSAMIQDRTSVTFYPEICQ